MADRDAVKRRLDKMVKKLDEIGPDVAEGWGGTILFKVVDLDTGWMMKFAENGTVESLEEKVEETLPPVFWSLKATRFSTSSTERSILQRPREEEICESTKL